MDSLSDQPPKTTSSSNNRKKQSKSSVKPKGADDATLRLIKEVQKRKQEIADAERPNWKTNCSIRHPLTGVTHNLHVEASLATLMSLVVELAIRKEAHERVCPNWGVDPGVATLHGFPLQDWLHDLSLRICKVQVSDKKLQLEKLEARLNAIVSPELRAQMELEAIQQELGLE